jgi:hypothetical protein
MSPIGLALLLKVWYYLKGLALSLKDLHCPKRLGTIPKGLALPLEGLPQLGGITVASTLLLYSQRSSFA